MDDEFRRFNGYGEADTFGNYPQQEQAYGAEPDDFWPYGPMGPGGAPLIAQQAPIYAGPYTDWGWGYGASLRGYGPGYAATGMGSGPTSIGDFMPGSFVEYGPLDGQGYFPDYRPSYGSQPGPWFAPPFGPAFAPGFPPQTASGYGPGFQAGAFQPTPYPAPFAPLPFAPASYDNPRNAALAFGAPGPFAAPPFVRVLGYIVVPGSPYVPESQTPASASRGAGAASTATTGQSSASEQQLLGGGGPQAVTALQQQGQTARHGPYSGVGPQNYVRSDMRIHEDIHERMTAHGHLDASGLTISVEHGIVTLNGVVPDRAQKRLAEDIADSVPGVKDVTNHLSVQPQRFPASQTAAGGAAATQ